MARSSKFVPTKVPDAIKGDFSGFVIDEDGMHLRAVKRYDEAANGSP